MNLKKVILSLNPAKIPTDGVCPKCGAPLYIVWYMKSKYILCAKITCDYISKIG